MVHAHGFTDVSPSLFASEDIPAQSVDARLPPYVCDHRKRLRERFLACGPGAIPDYEMLEMVLFRAVPKRDVKPMAHRLLASFGDFGRVLAATREQLTAIPGVGIEVICELKLAEAVAHRMKRALIMNRPVISNWDALLDYCHTSLSHAQSEQFRVLFLDRKNVLIADEAQGQGTVDHVPVYPREVIKRALALNASALILVHNHPSGDPTPSDADIAMTERIRNAGDAMGIVVHDHLIIGKSCEMSFRTAGYI